MIIQGKPELGLQKHQQVAYKVVEEPSKQTTARISSKSF